MVDWGRKWQPKLLGTIIIYVKPYKEFILLSIDDRTLDKIREFVFEYEIVKLPKLLWE